MFDLVVSGPEGEELTIWDSKESEFASGLEYKRVFRYVFFSLCENSQADNSVL